MAVALIACQKENPADETPPVTEGTPAPTNRMVLTTASTTFLTLSLTANLEDRAGVWIDLNNNGKQEVGEKVNNFRTEVKENYILNGSQTITIYGKITSLHCDGAQLTQLNVSNNPALERLDCDNNDLSSLDLTKNVSLTVLSCVRNKLTALDVSKNTALTHLNCRNNELTSLNTSGSASLTRLDCVGNKLSSLDVSGNKALTTLTCRNNRLTSLNTSENIALSLLDCESNNLGSLNLSTNTALSILYCNQNKIKSADMRLLINSLPDKSDEAQAFILGVSPEGNELPTTVVTFPLTKPYTAVAKNKNWKLYRYTDSNSTDLLNP